MHIKSIKKKGSEYLIILDDETLKVNEEVLINNNILYSKKLSNKDIKKIKEETVYYENYSKALKMINRKMRSEKEIRKNLKDISKEEIDKIIDKLKEINLLNNEVYAESYVNDKINLSLDGPYKIKKELELNDIESEYIEKALEKFTQDLIDEKLEKLINKKLKTNKDTEYIFKQKTALYLLNLGYSKEDINSHLENIKIDNSNLEKEMEKIYNKLKTKYEGYTLKNKLKQKLYLKGFNNDEINNFIEKTVH